MTTNAILGDFMKKEAKHHTIRARQIPAELAALDSAQAATDQKMKATSSLEVTAVCMCDHDGTEYVRFKCTSQPWPIPTARSLRHRFS